MIDSSFYCTPHTPCRPAPASRRGDRLRLPAQRLDVLLCPPDRVGPRLELHRQRLELRLLEHTRLDPADIDGRGDLVKGPPNELEAGIGVSDCLPLLRIPRAGTQGWAGSLAHLSAFMIRCSTSCTGNRVASAIDWKVMSREAPSRGRAKAVWMSAMRQIFCRKNGSEFSRIG